KWSLFFEFFCLMFRLLRRSTIFPYTTLFRSYQYKLGSGTFGSEATFSGLSAGNYVVTVKDETGCFININASVASNTGITYNGDILTIFQAKCQFAGCHPDNGNWFDYNTAKANAAAI